MSSMRGAGTQAISEVLVDGLRNRLSGIAPGSEGRVVAAGTFAQRVVAAAFPDLTPAHSTFHTRRSTSGTGWRTRHCQI